MANTEIQKIPRLTSNTASIYDLENIALDLRKTSFEMILNAGSGHLGGSSSSVELMTVLYFGGILKYDPINPKHPMRDMVLVRGHIGPLRYPIFAYLGYIEENELKGYRRLGTRLHGHESMDHMPGVDITPSGCLGMLLSYGVGGAIADRLNNTDRKIYVFLGDGEEQEGNVSEAARYATNLELSNLVCILDQNKKQLSRSTVEVDSASDVAKIWSGYGWKIHTIHNGHDSEEILNVLQGTLFDKGPHMVIAKTIKGFGLPGAETHFSGAHTIGTFRNNSAVVEGIRSLEEKMKLKGTNHAYVKKRIDTIVADYSLGPVSSEHTGDFQVNIQPDISTPTHLETAQIPYFHKLLEVVKSYSESAPKFYTSTPDFVLEPLVDIFKLRELGAYLDVGLREQHSIAMSHGISTINPSARIVHFYGDAFIYRCMDQINVSVQGHSKMMILAERAGICQDRNGQSHQTAGHPGAILTMPGVYFKEPGDVEDLYNVFNWFFTENPGIVYVRTHSKDTPYLEKSLRKSRDINYYVVHDTGSEPDLVYASSGLPLHNTIEAAKRLELEKKKKIRVINIIDPKSLDGEFVKLIGDGNSLITVYNGAPEVLEMAVSRAILANRDSIGLTPKVYGIGFQFGTTGTLEELERFFGLDTDGILKYTYDQIKF